MDASSFKFQKNDIKYQSVIFPDTDLIKIYDISHCLGLRFFGTLYKSAFVRGLVYLRVYKQKFIEWRYRYAITGLEMMLMGYQNDILSMILLNWDQF
jgi:hypothetical protein